MGVMENRKNFYIFLDIDGVLWDWDWRLEQIKQGNIKKSISISNFNQESIKALNLLISNISKRHNCVLVISSTWRTFMDWTKQVLIKNGVLLPQTIDRTELPISTNRGVEIANYLHNKKGNKNFVILDDESKNIRKIFPENKIIKTNIKNKSLEIAQVENWLKNNFEFANEQEPELDV